MEETTFPVGSEREPRTSERITRQRSDLPAFQTRTCAHGGRHTTLVFRALTYGIQIPLGALTYVIWRANRSCRQPAAVPG